MQNRLEVTYNTVTMSIEQGYAVFLGSQSFSLSWEEYTVYSYLVRAGYYVFLPDAESDEKKYKNSLLKNQLKTENQMIMCVLNENLNLPFSFDFVSSNHDLYLKTKKEMQDHFKAISCSQQDKSDSINDDESNYEPPLKKFKSVNTEQERNFLDILKAESEYLTYQDIFKKFSSIYRNESISSISDDKKLAFSFDICYQKSKFKRTEQLADYRMLVLSPDQHFPTNDQLKYLRKSQPYEVPIIIAVVSQSIQFSICKF